MDMLTMYKYTFTLTFALLTLPGPSCIYSDNLGLLATTSKDMHRFACDDEQVSLGCPTGTFINIQEAKYGKAPEDHTCLHERPNMKASGENCLWPTNMQYSLLKTVVEECRRKPNCKFSTRLLPGQEDPCPDARKYVKVTYKCRPYEFRSRVVCENDTLKLICNPYSRIVIYNAEYGRTALELVCLQTKEVNESCKSSLAANTVMQKCHGKRRCEIVADNSTFGTPCKSVTKPYLKVIYTCVPLGVLTPQYESPLEDDEMKDGVTTAGRISDLFDKSVSPGDKWAETGAYTPMANPALQQPVRRTTPVPPTKDVSQDPPSTSLPINTEKTQSQPNILIYIGISILLFIIFIILLIGVRCYIKKKAESNSKNGDMFTTEAPNVFSDAASDIDNDIDVTHISGTFYDPAHPDMILYRDVPGSKGTLRAMRPLSTIYPCAGTSMYGNIDHVPPQYRQVAAGRLSREASRDKEDVEIDHEVVVSPKSLGRYSNSQYYYG